MSASFINPECPFLPSVQRVFSASDVRALGADRGAGFYRMSLNYAQSQWRVGLPAQALLQVNRALACFLKAEEAVLAELPLPYQAMAWLIGQRVEGQFIGNPRRHFQHLATRMVEPHKELRKWRAWACWYLATLLLPEGGYPGDAAQIRKEGVVEPTRAEIRARLRECSPADDEQQWLAAVLWATVRRSKPVPRQPKALSIDLLGVEELGLVHDLAHRIWPVVYPGIISMAQIDFMLERMYALPVLRADAGRGVNFSMVRDAGLPIGYIACEARTEAGEMFLHKLYLLPEYAGGGVGALMLKWVCDQAQGMGLRRIALRVNRANAGAIRAYRRAGFEFHKEVITQFGDGFVMDDYEMVKTLSP